jgi:hypothetical protein
MTYVGFGAAAAFYQVHLPGAHAMKASGIVYLVLKGLPTPIGMAGHRPQSGGKDVYEAERALAREEATHAFLSHLIRARALLPSFNARTL